MVRHDVHVWVERTRRCLGHLCLGLLYVLLLEEELPVQVGQVDCVEVDLRK